MLVNSSQSSTQRPLGLSVEELFALDRQYRRIEQQQQHIAQLQSQTRVTSSNLNRLASRSLDLISSPPPSSPSPLNPLTVLPSLHVHGQGYTNRSQHPPLSVLNYPRSHSIDHQQYVTPNPPPPLLKHTYPQRSTTNDVGYQRYQPKYKPYVQQSTGKTLVSGSNFAYDLPQSSIDYSDNRSSCKLRRQHPIKRESSRRIVVRPVIHRRREPSISSSCESLDEPRAKNHYLPTESYTSHQSITFAPSPSLVEDAIDDLPEDTNNYNNDSLSDDSEINLYEMRVSIGKTYDTSDIGVQLEGAKVLIHCHTIEPTDKRGNYRKHELKTELFVPDIVDDSTIVAYLTEDGELIVEGKYHLWAWKEIKKKRQIEKEQLNISPSSKSTTIKNDRRGSEQEKNRIEKIDNNRTVIHVGDSPKTNDITNRLNSSNIWDGQYLFTNDNPPILIYHLCLPFDTLMDTIRIQSDPQLNVLKVFLEKQNKSRLCRLPKDYIYDYTRLRINFLKNNFIRIEIPTLN